jgi:protein involved in sex pheromone biosynthesis
MSNCYQVDGKSAWDSNSLVNTETIQADSYNLILEFMDKETRNLRSREISVNDHC